MKITDVTTLRLGQYPNLTFVIVTTDDGASGLGETFFGSRAVTSWIHETAAPYLLGQDPLDIERHSTALQSFVGFTGTGVENRGRSAIDIALWDLLAQQANLPLYRLLGGLTRKTIRIYNTCAGPTYVRAAPRSPDLPTDNWIGDEERQGKTEHSDLHGFLTNAGALAEDLLAEGITAMKIWPFDAFAEASGGHAITTTELRQGLEPFRRVRETVGDRMELMVEMHSKWDLPTAIKIIHAVEEYQPSWIEDPLRMNCLDALADLAASTPVPVAASETVATGRAFRELIEHGGARIVLFDPAWAGGITEARKIIALADARQLPVAPHDCAGPVNFVVGVHLTAAAPNAFIQEGVRAFYRGWYRELVSELPPVTQGYVAPLHTPGHGTRLRPEVWKRPDAEIETSS